MYFLNEGGGGTGVPEIVLGEVKMYQDETSNILLVRTS